MRKLKFRAWNKHLKCYEKDIQSYASFDVDGTINNIDYVVLEQFTGLYDKNGVEIYEGDYLVDRYPINDEDLSEGYNESLMPVMWCNKKSCWCVDVTFTKNGKRLEPIHSYFGEHLEVKGNIHEKTISKNI